MSIVIIIIAVIVGMTVVSGIATLNSARLAATQKKMAAIDQALMAYRLAHDQLPCPSDLTQVQGGLHYGTSQTQSGSTTGTTGYCQQVLNSSTGLYGVRISNNSAGTAVAAAEGGVPVVDLGLPFDFMYDGWGYHFRYAVDVTMAYTGTTSGVLNNSNTFSGTQIGAPYGAITIYGDPMPNSVSYPSSHYGIGYSAYLRSSNAIYALISQGPNSSDAYTPNGQVNATWGTDNLDEGANCSCSQSGYNTNYTPYYVQEQPYIYNKSDPGSAFDDIVTYKERWQMQGANDTWGNAIPRVYVADWGNNRIEILDLNGKYVSQFTSSSAFSTPGGVFVDNANNAWVADTGNNRIQKCSLSASGTANCTPVLGCGYPSSNPVTSGCSGGSGSPHYYGGTGNQPGEFNFPSMVTLDNSGNIWVADANNSRIQEFNSSYNFILGIGTGYQGAGGTIGSYGYINGQLDTPYTLAIDPLGNIWVGDASNNRVQEFSSSGTWIQSIPSSCTGTCSNHTGTCPPSGSGGTCTGTCSVPACAAGNGSPQFNSVQGVASDQFGNIWVSDYNNNRLVELSNSGAYIASVSLSSGAGPNESTIDPAGNIWVPDNSISTIQKCACTATPCTSSSSWSCSSIGSFGSGNGHFNSDSCIAIPQTGMINYR